MSDKTQERISNCHYINTKDLVMKIRIVCECSQQDVGSFGEPYMNINGMSAERISPRGSGCIFLEHDGEVVLGKDYLVPPNDVYIFHCVGKVIEWHESYIEH
tara:strand:- start:221 stop:526 length:306 start_codon:yes stop_codon:yes gene_type:complete